VVLHPTVTRANAGGDLRWPEPIVVVAFVHVGGDPPMSVWVDLIGVGLGRRDVMIFIY
jgi:hypothetical protein